MIKIPSSIYKKEYLCNLCIYSKKISDDRVICHHTKKPPNFYTYCPYFKLYKQKIENRQNNFYKNDSEDGITALVIIGALIIWVIFVNLLFNITIPAVASITSFILFLIFTLITIYFLNRISQNKKNKIKQDRSFVRQFGWYPYFYIIFIRFLLDKKANEENENLNIIQQQIIKLFTLEIFSDVKKKLNTSALSYDFLKIYKDRLALRHRIIVFTAVCQFYAYNNLNNYLNDGFIEGIGEILDINYIGIKNIFGIDEQNHKKKIEFKQTKQEEKKKRLKEKRQQYYKSHTNYRFTKPKNTSNYNILGLQTNATVAEIKQKFRQLALKHHPDRYVGKKEIEIKQAEEKFKKITEAYNNIRRKRGF